MDERRASTLLKQLASRRQVASADSGNWNGEASYVATARTLIRRSSVTRSQMFAAVQLERHARGEVQSFQKAVMQLPEVLEVHHIAGAFDYMIRIAVADLASF